MEVKSNSFVVFNIKSNKDLKQISTFNLKFTVSAIGFDHLTGKFHLKDLTELITCLFGSHLSRCYSSRFSLVPVIEKLCENKSKLTEPTKSGSETAEVQSAAVLNTDSKTNPFFAYQKITTTTSSLSGSLSASSINRNKISNDYNSDFYRILFRGGLNLPNTPGNIKLLELLRSIFNFYDENELTDMTIKFMTLYDKNFHSKVNACAFARNKLGGLSVSELVLKIFVALIWQNPSVKYEDLFNKDNELLFNEKIAHALKTAEATRSLIIEQQQQFKMKNLSQNLLQKSQIDLIGEKALYLLKFDRVDEYLHKYELSQSGFDGEETLGSNSEVKPNLNSPSKKKSSSSSSILARLPKSDSYPAMTLVLEFLFDKHIDNLDFLDSILKTKSDNANMICRNLELTTKYLKSLYNEAECVQNLENILLFLSSFFGYRSVNDKPEPKLIAFPPSLKHQTVHYMQSLYGCGTLVESELQRAYYEHLEFLVKFNCGDVNSTNTDNAIIDRLKTRLKAFQTCLIDVDWQVYDWKFVNDLRLIGKLFLVKLFNQKY